MFATPTTSPPPHSSATRRIVVAAQPQAAGVGLEIMQRGGNAVDAAIATAAALMVLEPVSSGLGSDAFALVWQGGEVHALNASGRSPLTPIPGYAGGPVPSLGWPGVTVPGAVSGWIELSRRFGRLPWADMLEPAIDLAEHGYAVTPVVSRVWRGLRALYRSCPDVLACYYADWPRGPEPGAWVRLPQLAQSLRLLAESGGQALYDGALAEAMVRHAQTTGGHLGRQDLLDHRCAWVAPLTLRYREALVHEMPPNSQGIAALLALAILDRFEAPCGPAASAPWVHLQIEAMRLAFQVTEQHVADPAAMTQTAAELLASERVDRLAARIDPRRAAQGGNAQPVASGGTSYLTTADADGMVVSYIQSSGPGFGSGVLVPGTGIALQNRASAFHPDPSHPNGYAPGKLPLHSNCPALVTRDGAPTLSFGLMGWNMQPQAHVQFLGHALDHGQTPQAVLHAARWRLAAEEDALLLEPALAEAVGAELAAMGHRIVQTERFLPASTPFGSHLMFGGASLLAAGPGGWIGAADPRRDGAVAGG